eukprot:365608-Chlamydomonas_euryale.AAC.8
MKIASTLTEISLCCEWLQRVAADGVHPYYFRQWPQTQSGSISRCGTAISSRSRCCWHCGWGLACATSTSASTRECGLRMGSRPASMAFCPSARTLRAAGAATQRRKCQEQHHSGTTRAVLVYCCLGYLGIEGLAFGLIYCQPESECRLFGRPTSCMRAAFNGSTGKWAAAYTGTSSGGSRACSAQSMSRHCQLIPCAGDLSRWISAMPTIKPPFPPSAPPSVCSLKGQVHKPRNVPELCSHAVPTVGSMLVVAASVFWRCSPRQQHEHSGVVLCPRLLQQLQHCVLCCVSGPASRHRQQGAQAWLHTGQIGSLQPEGDLSRRQNFAAALSRQRCT